MKRYLLSVILLCLASCSECYAGYTIFIRDQVTPQYIMVQGVGKTEQALNPGPVPVYPAGTAVFYAPPGLDIYSADPLQRRVLLTDPAGTATEAEIMAAFPDILEAKYERLWAAAAAWEKRNISGVALSLLTLGVSQGKPKALAIANWSSNLWNGIYYPRKAAVRFDTDPDYDFSVAGDMPYTVPDLSAEVWGQ